MSVYIYIYIYIFIYSCIRTNIRIHTCIHAYIYIDKYTYIYTYIYILYTYMHVSMVMLTNSSAGNGTLWWVTVFLKGCNFSRLMPCLRFHHETFHELMVLGFLRIILKPNQGIQCFPCQKISGTSPLSSGQLPRRFTQTWQRVILQLMNNSLLRSNTLPKKLFPVVMFAGL